MDGVSSKGLPRTIEEAARRYIHHYESNYRGPAKEMTRLSGYAEAKIFRLRKKAPKFFEEKLPILVNQAASALLACDAKTPTGVKKFNETHGNFLRILDELTRSQPPGEVNFQAERERAQERDRLLNRQITLRTEIEKLEATEFDGNEIGEDDDEESECAKVFQLLDKKKAELRKVSLLIATMEGQNVNEEVTFKLKVPERSYLSKLDESQINNLEEQIKEFLQVHKNRLDFYVDKSIIDNMLAKLNLGDRFNKEEMRQLSKDALDAYRQFYRELDKEWREEYFNHLCTNKTLMPKEGVILKGPEDVPDHIKQELDRNDLCYKRKLDEHLEEFTQRVGPDELVPEVGEAVDKDIDDDDDEDSDEFTANDDTTQVLNEIKAKSHIFVRVKEEPRDDYDNEAPSDDELLVTSDVGQHLESETMIEMEDIQKNGSTSTYASNPKRFKTNPPEVDSDNGDNDSDDDDDIEFIGTVEPSDNVTTVELD